MLSAVLDSTPIPLKREGSGKAYFSLQVLTYLGPCSPFIEWNTSLTPIPTGPQPGLGGHRLPFHRVDPLGM